MDDNGLPRAGVVLALVLALAACAPEPVAELEECEPGVADLSRIDTVAPPCP